MESFIAPKKRVPTKLNSPLAHSFGFDYGDLQDNRSGFISHWQKKRLRWYLFSYTVSILVWLGITTFFPIGIILDAGRITPIAGIWVAIALVVLGLFWFWQIRSVYLDMRRGKVTELIAEVNHIRNVRNQRRVRGLESFEHSEMHYYVMIGKERFIATHQQMEAFQQGILYHVYISPESRQILSAEPVTQDELDNLADSFVFEKNKSNEDYMLISDDDYHKTEKDKR